MSMFKENVCVLKDMAVSNEYPKKLMDNVIRKGKIIIYMYCAKDFVHFFNRIKTSDPILRTFAHNCTKFQVSMCFQYFYICFPEPCISSFKHNQISNLPSKHNHYIWNIISACQHPIESFMLNTKKFKTPIYLRPFRNIRDLQDKAEFREIIHHQQKWTAYLQHFSL